jgi:hypothetical protein
VGVKAGLDAVVTTDRYGPCRESKHDSFVIQPVT